MSLNFFIFFSISGSSDSINSSHLINTYGKGDINCYSPNNLCGKLESGLELRDNFLPNPAFVEKNTSSCEVRCCIVIFRVDFHAVTFSLCVSIRWITCSASLTFYLRFSYLVYFINFFLLGGVEGGGRDDLFACYLIPFHDIPVFF